MKKLMYIFGIAALMLAAGCKKDDGWNIPNGIKPVKPSKELAAFFENPGLLLPLSLFGEYNEELERWLRRDVDTCIMINSVAEFQAIDFSAGTSLELPSIDFNKYTLVIGQYVLMSGRISFLGQAVVVGQETVTMNIVLGVDNDKNKGYTQNIVISSFWGLYPKLTVESIQTNVVFKK